MKKLLRSIQPAHWVWFSSAILVFGMILSFFLQSIGMFGLAAYALFSWNWDKRFPIGIRQGWSEHWQAFIRRPDYWITAGYFAVVLVGVFPLYDQGYWLERLRIKVPFLVLPWVYFLLPRFTERQFQGLLYFILLIMTATSACILINYLAHFEAIQLLLKQGQPMPTPGNHIRFSLLLAMTIIGGGYLVFQQYYWLKVWEKWLIRGLTLGLFVFMHILSVRSGLAALYLALGGLALRYAWVSGRYWIAIGAVSLLLALPIVGYYSLPSFKMKIDYTLWDFQTAMSGDNRTLSDGDRMRSLRIGWSIFKAAPLTGIGPGNLHQEVERIYATQYPEVENRLIPHNQFIFVLAGTGVVGMAIFLLSFIFPFFYRKNYENWLFLATYIVIFTSFMVEATIENSTGVALFCFFYFLSLGRKQQEPISN
jgi:O-antigen ligase